MTFPQVRIHRSLAALAVAALLLVLSGCTVDLGRNVTLLGPAAVADDPDACKDGGWRMLVRADGTAFDNQGACVSYATQAD